MTDCDTFIETIWAFARGDTPTPEFEQWIYSEASLEKRLGRRLYLDIISANYSNCVEADTIRKQLAEYARGAAPLRCECVTLPALTVLDMGSGRADIVYRTLEVKKTRGEPYWWLGLIQCRECKLWWLVAQEERQNDVFILRRLDAAQAEEIIGQGCWPTYFDHYETLLRIGRDAGRSVRFMDPANSSLLWTIRDLARERPGISIFEIAELLNLDLLLAVELAKKVDGKDGIVINFEAVNP